MSVEMASELIRLPSTSKMQARTGTKEGIVSGGLIPVRSYLST